VVQQRPDALVEITWVGQVIEDRDEPDAGRRRLARGPLSDAPALSCLGLVGGEEPHPTSQLVLVDDLGVWWQLGRAALLVGRVLRIAALFLVLAGAVDDELAAETECPAGMVEDI